MSAEKRKYRSSAWFAKPDKDGFIHRSWVGRGLPEGIFDGRPIIGICNTFSELTPCNTHFRELARRNRVARGDLHLCRRAAGAMAERILVVPPCVEPAQQTLAHPSSYQE